MYVDGSGSANLKDKTKEYIISGVIVHEGKVKDLKKAICQYKINNCTGEYIDAGIILMTSIKAEKNLQRLL